MFSNCNRMKFQGIHIGVLILFIYFFFKRLSSEYIRFILEHCNVYYYMTKTIIRMNIIKQINRFDNANAREQ